MNTNAFNSIIKFDSKRTIIEDTFLGYWLKTSFDLVNFIQCQMTYQQASCRWTQIQFVVSFLFPYQILGNTASKSPFTSSSRNHQCSHLTLFYPKLKEVLNNSNESFLKQLF